MRPLLSLLLALACRPLFAAATVTLERATGRQQQRWKLERTASDDDSLRVLVALRQPRMGELKARLVEGTKHLGTKHLSREQVREYGRPDQTSVDSVLGWLGENGIRARQVGSNGWVGFNMTAGEARRLLGAELAWYSWGEEVGKKGQEVLRAREYSVPAWLARHIDFVHPLTHFMTPRSERKKTEMQTIERRAAAEDPCATGVFPECIRKLYNMTYRASRPSPCRFGVAGFLEQYVNYDDVQDFIDIYAPELADLRPAYNFSVELVNNGSNPQEPVWLAGLEASLDVQYAMAIGYPSQVTYYSTGGRGVKLDGMGSEIPTTGSDNEPFLDLLEALAAKPDAAVPHVLSISYADDEQSVPRPYAERVCDLLAQLAARGVTVLAASGDGGAAGTGQNLCYANDSGTRKPMLIPTFPAGCPWVTAVGATRNDPPGVAADFSAGGFSRYFARPAWQDEAVAPYLERLGQRNSSKIGLFNASGRAIPDISAVGSAFQIEFGGGGAAVLGTSASTPVVAGMVALVNDARLRANRSSLGWLNPRLYGAEVRSLLTDVTRGRGQGCTFDNDEEADGWAAERGYDCVTGLGVPEDFGRLFSVLVGDGNETVANGGV